MLRIYRGKRPRIVLAVIGGAINSSSIISSVSSSPVNDDDDFVGDCYHFKWKRQFSIEIIQKCNWILRLKFSFKIFQMFTKWNLSHRLIRIEHLNFIIFSAGRCAPHFFTWCGRSTFFTIFRYWIVSVLIVNIWLIATIPSAQITIEKSSWLLQETAGTICPIPCTSIVYFFGNNSNVCGNQRISF